jgi:hypothetical protein
MVMDYEILGDGGNDTLISVHEGKGPKHHKIKKVYKFGGDSTFCHGFMNFSGNFEPDIDKMIVKDLDGDSLELYISKMIDKDFGKPDHFTWQSDQDFFKHPGYNGHLSAKVRLELASDNDLKQVKLDKSFKKLDLDEFMAVFNGMEMDLSFSCKEKGDLSLNIYDEKGNSVLLLEKQDFQGKFDKEIDLPMGNLILQITQNNRHYVKKLRLE